MDYYIMVVTSVTDMVMSMATAFVLHDLGFLKLANFGYFIAAPRFFCPWTYFYNIGVNMLQSDSFMASSYSQL